jgi:hypothetical protein
MEIVFKFVLRNHKYVSPVEKSHITAHLSPDPHPWALNSSVSCQWNLCVRALASTLRLAYIIFIVPGTFHKAYYGYSTSTWQQSVTSFCRSTWPSQGKLSGIIVPTRYHLQTETLMQGPFMYLSRSLWTARLTQSWKTRIIIGYPIHSEPALSDTFTPRISCLDM